MRKEQTMTKRENSKSLTTPQGAQVQGMICHVFNTLFGFLKFMVSTFRNIIFSIYYPLFIDRFYTKEAAVFRKDVFADIGEVEPSDTKDGRVRILEVGPGPGCNLDYFPKQCRLIAVDRNSHFKSVLQKNLKKHPGIHLEEWFSTPAEDMSCIPSNSVDIVVSSCLHCSVDNSQTVLKEMKRVLVPGGRYYYYEHVLDEPDTIRYKWQRLLNVTGVWKLIGNGCTFINFEPEIAKAGFEKYCGKPYVLTNYFSISYYFTYLVASHWGGYAVKGKE